MRMSADEFRKLSPRPVKRAVRASKPKKASTPPKEPKIRLHWLEDDIQIHCAAALDKLKICYAASLEGMKLPKRLAAKARRMGMKAGETDFRLYLPGPRLVLIELKTIIGKKSEAQIKRHALFELLGFEVYTIYAKTGHDAMEQILKIIARE